MQVSLHLISRRGRPTYVERSISDRLDSDDGEAGYLYVSKEAPWPDDAAEFIPKLPDTWFTA